MKLLFLSEVCGANLEKEYLTDIPKQEFWHYSRKAEITDVPIWEEVYYDPGVIGVYGAWSPLAEYYMIVHPTMLGTDNYIETFYGPDASKQTWLRLRDCGVKLELHNKWVDDINTWLKDETIST